MRRSAIVRRILVRALGAGLFASGVLAVLPAGAQPARVQPTEELVMVPKAGAVFNVELETTIFRPAGEGPFPLVVINHGKAPGKPSFQGRARFTAQSLEFVRRGYVVALPMRQGFSRSGGAYIGGGCNVESNGLVQAEDVVAALDYLVQLPYVDRNRIVVIGQSHGGLTTMAFGTIAYPGVRGVVNFAGGLRNDNCVGWERNLIDAFADYGRRARYPSLWIYGDNDSYWPRPMPSRMFAAYRDHASGAAAQTRLVDIGEFEADSHKLFSSPLGIAVWLPEVSAFFRTLDLPFESAEPGT